MSRSSLGRWLGAAVAILGTLLVLSGSDLPPPPGFIFIVIASSVLGLLVALLTPRLLELADSRGPGRALLTAAGLGAASGIGIALLSMPLGGEPSVSAGAKGTAVFFAVLSTVGALGALATGVWALLADRSKDRAKLVVLIPVGLAALGLLAVIGLRLS